MPPRWNAWTHLQAVQFDHEREPKMRQVRLCGPSIVPAAVLFAVYRFGYNSGYRKALEKMIDRSAAEAPEKDEQRRDLPTPPLQ